MLLFLYKNTGWLTPDFLCRMNGITKDVVCFNTSSMDDAISGGVLVGRHCGGLSILVVIWLLEQNWLP